MGFINILLLMLLHKPPYPQKSFFYLSQRGGIAAADIALPALPEGGAGDDGYLLLLTSF